MQFLSCEYRDSLTRYYNPAKLCNMNEHPKFDKKPVDLGTMATLQRHFKLRRLMNEVSPLDQALPIQKNYSINLQLNELPPGKESPKKPTVETVLATVYSDMKKYRENSDLLMKRIKSLVQKYDKERNPGIILELKDILNPANDFYVIHQNMINKHYDLMRQIDTPDFESISRDAFQNMVKLYKDIKDNTYYLECYNFSYKIHGFFNQGARGGYYDYDSVFEDPGIKEIMKSASILYDSISDDINVENDLDTLLNRFIAYQLIPVICNTADFDRGGETLISDIMVNPIPVIQKHDEDDFDKKLNPNIEDSQNKPKTYLPSEIKAKLMEIMTAEDIYALVGFFVGENNITSNVHSGIHTKMFKKPDTSTWYDLKDQTKIPENLRLPFNALTIPTIIATLMEVYREKLSLESSETKYKPILFLPDTQSELVDINLGQEILVFAHDEISGNKDQAFQIQNVKNIKIIYQTEETNATSNYKLDIQNSTLSIALSGYKDKAIHCDNVDLKLSYEYQEKLGDYRAVVFDDISDSRIDCNELEFNQDGQYFAGRITNSTIECPHTFKIYDCESFRFTTGPDTIIVFRSFGNSNYEGKEMQNIVTNLNKKLAKYCPSGAKNNQQTVIITTFEDVLYAGRPGKFQNDALLTQKYDELTVRINNLQLKPNSVSARAYLALGMYSRESNGSFVNTEYLLNSAKTGKLSDYFEPTN